MVKKHHFCPVNGFTYGGEFLQIQLSYLLDKRYQLNSQAFGKIRNMNAKDLSLEFCIRKRNIKVQKKDIGILKHEARNANRVLGAKDIFMYDFPDNRFDAVPILEIIKTIEKIKNKIKPDVVFTHHHGDLNIDHRITYGAVLTASRPVKGETAKEIYSFEVPSSTEWNYPASFSPNTFIDITGTLDKKIEAMKCYKTEVRKAPHPRSDESIKAIARRWGSIAGLRYAEAFQTIRHIR